MTQLLLWMIIAYGISNIVVYGKIFDGPRELVRKWAEHPNLLIQPSGIFIKDMTSCMMCFGFHLGWFLTLVFFSPTSYIMGTSPYISWFFDACLSSGSVWIINSVVEWFEENRPVNQHYINLRNEDSNNNQIL